MELGWCSVWLVTVAEGEAGYRLFENLNHLYSINNMIVLIGALSL
jgi:hypothetical protein